MVRDEPTGRTTENTGRLKLLQNYSVIFHIDFDFVALGNIQCAAKLNRQYDSAQIVYLSDDSCRLHIGQLPPVKI